LGAERLFLRRYADKLAVPHKANLRAGVFTGLASGLGQGMPYIGFGLAFYASSRFVLDGKYTFLQVNTAMTSVLFTAMALGQIASFAPDINKAKQAAIDLFALIDLTSDIDPLSKEGKKLDEVKGDVAINNVEFSYPKRPDAKVLGNVSISVKSGQTLALVGESGSGKSTMVWLLERFYGRIA
jgi:ATP-binding cassette subfamily B (MDR/TAP) protein 1